ncbi:MAG: ABC transporter permease [Bacteroidetes bacterium]|nr:ABC transporter permease [Bacteroidota bacterium]
MNYELFIAKRIIKGGRGGFSGPVVKISVVSVALGLAVMIVAVAIVTGFQRQIQEKITGFGAHIQIAKFDANNSFEFSPISSNQSFYPSLEKEYGIKHIQVFGVKAGIVQTSNEIQGIVLKGVGRDFDWTYFKDKLVQGRTFYSGIAVPNDSVIISRSLASVLKLKTGDPLRTYFIINNEARARKFIISGIYNTGLEEFDKLYIFGDIKQIQKLNGWDSTQVSGFEVLVDRFDELKAITADIYKEIGYDMDARSIREMYPQLFDWLDLQDINVAIILILMVLVSGIAMISTLLILILERSNMIGILKALGARNFSIRRIFLYNAAYIISRGLLWGNTVGILICLLQKYFGIIHLNEESYFMSTVPINFDLFHIFLLNAGTMAVCILMLIIPSLIISRIVPARAIRFD